MRPEVRRSALRRATLWATVLLAACDTQPAVRPPAPVDQVVNAAERRDAAVALSVAGILQTMQRLAQVGAAEQAEMVAAARASYERTPMGSAQLHYALVLAVPDLTTTDVDRARSLLRELAAQPESLAAAERALLLVELAHLDHEFALRGEKQQLQSAGARSDRERQTVANRRLQSEIDENAKLREQLEEAQAKLDAITQIERNLTDRQPVEGHK